MNLFIDTNVLLNFYHFSKDNLDELQKVLVLQGYGKLNLWATDQVQIEFYRNREVKIADALKKFTEEKPSAGVPHVARGYAECDALQEALKMASTSKETLLQKVHKDIKEKSLVADKLVADIFAKATKIPMSEANFLAAKRRSELRNPPGKNGSLGDAVNWECLLSTIPTSQDLFLVSEDGDFSSPIDPEQIGDFLASEWRNSKKSEVRLFKRVSQFLSEKFPAAKVAADLEKNLLIAELKSSSSFSQTHSLIAKLSVFTSFSAAQATEIASAYLENAQVNWISSDTDVKNFGEKIIHAHVGALSDDQKKALAGG